MLRKIASGKQQAPFKGDEVDLFIQHYDLKEGPNRVFNWEIYWAFKKDFPGSALTKKKFIQEFNKRGFKSKRAGYHNRRFGTYYYMINCKFNPPLEIKAKHEQTKEQQKKAKRYLQKVRESRKYKTENS